MAIAVIAMLFTGDWLGAATFFGFLAVAALLTWERYLPAALDCIFTIIALINAAGWSFSWYEGVPFYDEIAHLLTTYAIALAGGYRLYRSAVFDIAGNRPLFVLVVTNFGMAIGAGWEILEWCIGVIGSLDDTVSDLALDSLGALCAGFSGLWIAGRSQPSSMRR